MGALSSTTSRARGKWTSEGVEPGSCQRGSARLGRRIRFAAINWRLGAAPEAEPESRAICQNLRTEISAGILSDFAARVYAMYTYFGEIAGFSDPRPGRTCRRGS